MMHGWVNAGMCLCGVADLATETHIYEVDRLAKWHERIGQVLHYRDDSGKQGVLVLILPDGYSDWVRLEKLERKRCKPYDMILIVLVRTKKKGPKALQRYYVLKFYVV